MALSFRHRTLLVLLTLGTVPAAAAVLGWALTLRENNPGAASRAAVEELAGSGREMLSRLDTTRLTAPERQALAEHANRLNEALNRVQRAEAYSQYYSTGLTVVLLAMGGIVIVASARLGGHLFRQLSRPIDELVGWTARIRQGESLPNDRPFRGAPEFAVLRNALREMADGLAAARARELEAERLRTFREMARRVAHEMKNPLTPIRFAVAQLTGSAAAAQREALEVIATEADRLEQLAREFTEFGRLPEGPAAEVDLGELLTELARTSLPPGMEPVLEISPRARTIVGHYDPLRRAFSNILRNAAEATGGSGRLDLALAPDGDGAVVVTIQDHGPGIPPDMRDHIFEPYVTGRSHGTGLGLTLVRQTIEAHGGTIGASETAGGGASFVVRLPVSGER